MATRRAANAAKKSADVAEKALLAANNPIVTVTELELRDANENVTTPHIYWSLRNSGSGMAVVHTMHTRTLISIVTPAKKQIIRSKEKVDWGSVIESKDTARGFSITTSVIQIELPTFALGLSVSIFSCR